MDLIERLRAYDAGNFHPVICTEAADALTALRAEVERLRGALRDAIHAIQIGDLYSEEIVTGILSRARTSLGDW